MLKRAAMWIFIIFLLTIVSAYFFGPSNLKKKIKSDFAQSGIEFDYTKLKLASVIPTNLVITDLEIKKEKNYSLYVKKASFEINLLDILVHWKNKFVRSEILIDDIIFNYEDLEPSGTSQKNPMTASPARGGDLKDYLKSNFGISEMDFYFKIAKFDYNISLPMGKFRVYGNDTSLKVSGVDQPVAVTFNAFAYGNKGLGPFNNVYLPITFASQFTVSNGVANLLKSDFSFAGVKNNITGLVNLKNLDYDTTLKVQIPKIENLEFLKKHQAQLPFTDAAGTLSLDINSRGNLTDPIDSQIKGLLKLNSFSANANYKDTNLSVKGPLSLNLATAFIYMNKTPSITSASWILNMENSEIAYKDIFQKEKAVKLTTEGTVAYQSDLTIDRFKLLFHTLDVSAKGMASLQRASDLSFTVKPFKLQDFKTFLPNNKDFDISGNVEVDAQVKGFLNQPKYLSIDVKKIYAQNVNYFLKYKDNRLSVQGPLSFTFLGSLLIERAQVLKGSITGQADLTPLVVSHNGQSRKTNSDLFKANWSFQSHDGKLNIEKLYLNTFLTAMTLKGYPPLAKDDSFNLKLDLESMNWRRIKPFLPANEWMDTVSDMTSKGSIQASGKLDPLDIMKSKISVDGDMNSVIATVALPFNFHLSSAPISDNPMPAAILTTPEALIKDANILRAVRWNQKLSIQKITFKDSPAQFQNLSMKANLENNGLKINGEIGSIFNGKMVFTDVFVPLTTPDPKFKFNLASANLSFSPLVEFVMPEYKDLISGTTNFEVVGETKMPGTLNFKKHLAAKGSFIIPTSVLQTMKVIDEVKQKFAAIKDVGVPSAIPVSNMSASTESDFEINQSVITLTNFVATARNKDEIAFNGNIGFDLDSKIKGVLRLVNLPVKGDFLAANQNTSGQVEIPVIIEGNLKRPQWNFAGNTLDKMAQNFIDYQRNKAKEVVDRKVAEVKQQAQAEVDRQKQQAEKTLQQKKKELADEATKRLQGLFK